MPPADAIDFLGDLIHKRCSPHQLQSASAAVHTAASAYSRRDAASSFRADGGGGAGVLGKDFLDCEGSGEETDSDQGTASPRSAAARLAQTEAKALDTTANLRSLLAERDGVMTGAAPAASRPPVQERMAAPEAAAPEAHAATATAVSLPPTAGVESAGGLAVAPPLPLPDLSLPLTVPAPSSSQASLPPMAAAKSGAEAFSPTVEGWSLQSAGAQPPLPASAPSLPPPPFSPPPPPPPPPPSSGLPRSAGPASRVLGASDAEIEFIPLGRSSSGGGEKASPGPRRAVGAGVKVASTGKRSFFFSNEEQRRAAENAPGKGKAKFGTVPAVKTKIKVKKPRAGTKPKVAAAFSEEHQASLAKVRYFGDRGEIAESMSCTYGMFCLCPKSRRTCEKADD